MPITTHRRALLWADASDWPGSLSPDWFLRLADTSGFAGKRPAGYARTAFTLRLVHADARGDLLTAIRAARQFLAGPFAAMSLGHPHIGLLLMLAAFHSQRVGPGALLLSPANGSDRPFVLTDERSRVVRYGSATETRGGSRWQNAGLYTVGSEIFGFLKKEADRFPDLCRRFLSDAVPFFGMKTAQEPL